MKTLNMEQMGKTNGGGASGAGCQRAMVGSVLGLIGISVSTGGIGGIVALGAYGYSMYQLILDCR